MYEICPNFENCPIFKKELKLASEETAEIYKKLFCLAGKSGYSKCKRYIMSQITDVPVPYYVLPNCTLTIKQIIEKMKQEGQIEDYMIDWDKYRELVGDE